VGGAEVVNDQKLLCLKRVFFTSANTALLDLVSIWSSRTFLFQVGKMTHRETIFVGVRGHDVFLRTTTRRQADGTVMIHGRVIQDNDRTKFDIYEDLECELTDAEITEIEEDVFGRLHGFCFAHYKKKMFEQ